MLWRWPSVPPHREPTRKSGTRHREKGHGAFALFLCLVPRMRLGLRKETVYARPPSEPRVVLLDGLCTSSETIPV